MDNNKISLFRPVAPHYPISSPFGERLLKGESDFHKGIDFATPVGTAVAAMAPGYILKAGWQDDKDHAKGFGFRIWQEIKIDNKKFYLWYGHLESIICKERSYVQTGQLIGRTGNTGSSTGPHLHIGCRQVDTSNYFDMEFYS